MQKSVTELCVFSGNICTQLLHVQAGGSRPGIRHQHHAAVLQSDKGDE